jgi:hypothetical protein
MRYKGRENFIIVELSRITIHSPNQCLCVAELITHLDVCTGQEEITLVGAYFGNESSADEARLPRQKAALFLLPPRNVFSCRIEVEFRVQMCEIATSITILI